MMRRNSTGLLTLFALLAYHAGAAQKADAAPQRCATFGDRHFNFRIATRDVSPPDGSARQCWKMAQDTRMIPEVAFDGVYRGQAQ